MKRRLRIWDCAILLGAAAAIVVSSFVSFAFESERVPDEVFRLHILANSDSEEDQMLKYALRDMILEDFNNIFEGCENAVDAASAAEKNLLLIEQKAQEFVKSQGYNYTVKAEVTEMYFTTRVYGDTLTLPAGNYKALRILIGEGKGQNWWCLMFPPLCLPAAKDKTDKADIMVWNKWVEKNYDGKIQFRFYFYDKFFAEWFKK